MSIILDHLPLTAAADFIKAAPADVCQRVEQVWRAQFAKEATVRRLPPITQGLGRALALLDEATDPATKAVVLATSKEGWSALYFNSMDQEETLARGLAHHFQTEAVFFRVIPHTLQKKRGQLVGRYGTVRFTYVNGDTTRDIGAANDSGKWRFAQDGDPLPFEKTRRYQAPRAEDRFTPATLVEYLDAFGLRPFDDDSFVVDKGHPAFGLESVLKRGVEHESMTLAEMREDLGAPAEWLSMLHVDRASKRSRKGR